MLHLAEETEQLARLVAASRGATPEDVVREAVEQQARLAGVSLRQQQHVVDVARVEAITARSASRPLLDDRGAQDILDEAWGRERT